MKKVIEHCFYPLHFIEEPDKGDSLLEEINRYLAYDDLKLVKAKRTVKLVNMEDDILPFIDEKMIFSRKTHLGFLSAIKITLRNLQMTSKNH